MDACGTEALKVVLSVDPIKFPLTGIGRYTFELARGLKKTGMEDLQFLRGVQLQTTLPLIKPSQPMSQGAGWKRYAAKSRWAVSAFRTLSPWLKGQVLKNLDDYVFHGPNYHLPPFPGCSVVTIHDLSPYLWSASHPQRRVDYLKTEIENTLKRASALITDTEYTRQEVANFFGWPIERIHAVHLASAPEFIPRASDDLIEPLSIFGLETSGYTLFTGTVEPRKNIGVLLDAYSRLPFSVRQRWPLVIVGYRGWASEDLHARFERAQREGWLKYLGFVSNDLLPILMAGARLFVYPSLYEGFGLPVLEAMSCGVPVVCSNASTLPEVAGEAAAFHAPQDVDALLTLLKAGLEDDPWRESARKAGLAQSAKYSWGRCTRETLNVYKSVLVA